MAAAKRGGDGGGRRSRNEGTKSSPSSAKRNSGAPANNRVRRPILIGSVLTIVGVAILYQYLFSTSPETRLSVILRNQLRPVRQAVDQKDQLEAYLVHDPLADLLKTKLRPVQERIASLKTQTAQYEKMEQIPGGPTQFIDSSLKEIQTSIFDRVLELDKECNGLLKQYMDGALALAKSSTQYVASSALRLNDDHIRIMLLDGIYFTPIPHEHGGPSPEELEKLKQEVSIQQVARIVEELALLYEPLEQTVQELERVGQSLVVEGLTLNTLGEILKNVKSLSDDVYYRLEPGLLKREGHLKQLVEFKTKYGNHMQLFIQLHSEQMKQLNEITARLQDAGPNRRKPYLALYQSILDEIRNLRTRIENLKYKYVKQKTVDY